MKKINFILFLAATTFLLGCRQQAELTYNFDKSINFGNYKTFSIAKPSQGDMHFYAEKYPKIVNEDNAFRIEESLIKEMESRGYVQSAVADLTVSYFIQLQTNTNLQSNTISSGTTPSVYGYYGYYGGWGGVGGENIVTSNTRTGALIINVVDNKKNSVAWYGAASGVMSANPTKSYQNIPIRIKEIFSNFFWKAGQAEPVVPIPAK